MNRIIISIVVQAVALGGLAQAPAVQSPEYRLLTLLNMERLQARLTTFQWDDKIADAAQGHSQMLAGHRELSHRFDGEPELTHRVGVTGARFSAVAENVAVADDPDEAHAALMESPGHRANILNPNYNVVGIAVARVGKRIYVTEDFAHAVPTYSVEEFRQGVVAAFNQLRRSHHMLPLESQSDPALDQQACDRNADLQRVLIGLNHATRATMFNAAEPSQLPALIDQIASDVGLRRMSIGVCFRSEKTNAFPDFSVILAYYKIK